MELSNRMKRYEEISANQMLIPNLPAIVRIDGKVFHSWTRGLDRPFDGRLQDLFDIVTKELIEATNAVIGYTQSDEITLILWNYEKPDSEIFFNGRVAKLTSVLASMATAYFNRRVFDILPEKTEHPAFFDCRVFNVPSEHEAVNCLIWRELDATRNSISMAAQACYSPKQLHGKDTTAMRGMLIAKGIDWNIYPDRFKKGGYFRRRLVERAFTVAELAELPPMHDAHKNPDLRVIRHVIDEVELPPLLRVENRVDVIFNAAEPLAIAVN